MSTSLLPVIRRDRRRGRLRRPSVVQVSGRRRPVSAVRHGSFVARALGREDLQVRTTDASCAGFLPGGPSTGLAILRAPGLGLAAAVRSEAAPRVGQVALAVARSWSNAVTASAGIIAAIGGPLRTGRRHSIEQVIRTTIPMHDGFAGGPVLDATGRVIGVSTAAAIRGFEVAIPAAIAWSTAADVLKRGQPTRGFLGIAGQTVQLPEKRRGGAAQEQAPRRRRDAGEPGGCGRRARRRHPAPVRRPRHTIGRGPARSAGRRSRRARCRRRCWRRRR